MTTQLQVFTPEVLQTFKPEVLQVIRTSICPTATDPEFALFAHKCAVYNLDPFKNEIFFIKYGSQARIQFAAEAYLAKAREKEGFQPPDTQMVCENDEFKVSRNPETKELEVVVHEMGFPRGKIIGAYSIAYRDGYRPVTVVMDRTEIDHMFTGQNKDNWNKWTSDMFGKHVEQRGLKKQYGLDFGDDEIPQGSVMDNTSSYERKDITAEAEQMASGQRSNLPEPEPEEQPDPAKEEATKIEAARQQMKDKFKALGITGKEDKGKYINQHCKMKGDTPSLSEMFGLLKIMDMHIEEKKAIDAAADELED
ncbi:hypothetical protein E0485_14605 [Paenibacillus albiflavus]|uniref:Uncharacterized protein n=1 Tax=Paenibacillus albiflavus TaxID=2545760 RepID=A0A4R4E8G3_9BACL|nr:RecT family recombinase [Paenibacillus albiflavus]TCZ76074.1 hypothetical protein E0485_14605 [Paenibacillus albiflavus]